MSTNDTPREAIEILQQLGLKEYEAKCFVGLSRLNWGTAKQLSEITEVPRTRVYDAIRVLEAQGLVEIQHSNPQRFRAVPLEAAIETLRDQYDARVDRLANALESIEPVEQADEDPIQEVWSISGTEVIANRTGQLIEDTSDEVVLVLGEESLLTEELADNLNGLDSEVDLLVGAVSEPLEARIHDAIPEATTFLSGLGWLRNGDEAVHNLAIGRLLLVDRSTLLVSTIGLDNQKEQAIFAAGLRNGLVVIARRLMAQGLLAERDPHAE